MKNEKINKNGKKEKICILVGASYVVEEDFLFFYKEWMKEYNVFVIAADGGYQFMRKHQINTDLVVGDFDSYGRIPNEVEIIRHPVQKDDTDMLLAVREGLKRGYEYFAIFGGLSGRMDHSFANIQLLSFLRRHGGRGILFGDSMNMTTIYNEEIMFAEGFKGTISVFSIKECSKNVTIQNLKYELEQAEINHTFPIGVSNEFVDKKAKIKTDCGELLIMWERENRFLPEFGKK